MKNNFKVLLSIITLSVVLWGCSKSDDVSPSVQTQTVTLNFNHFAGSDTVNFSDVFTLGDTTRFTLSMFRYYVSNIRLVKENGSEHTVSGAYFLVSPNNPICQLKDVPVGSYKGIRFAVGIDSVTNHSDPTVYPSSNPLAIQSPGIHWSWNSGYIFMMIEGTVDTTADNNDVLTYGQFSHSLTFHIGMDYLYRKADLSSAFTVSASDEKHIYIKADINKFFGDTDLKTENVTHTFMNSTLAEKAAGNIPTMFSVMQ